MVYKILRVVGFSHYVKITPCHWLELALIHIINCIRSQSPIVTSLLGCPVSQYIWWPSSFPGQAHLYCEWQKSRWQNVKLCENETTMQYRVQILHNVCIRQIKCTISINLIVHAVRGNSQFFQLVKSHQFWVFLICINTNNPVGSSTGSAPFSICGCHLLCIPIPYAAGCQLL